jgi:hypothetical protein
LRNPGALATFVSFAADEKDAAATAAAAVRLAAFGRDGDTPSLFAACDRLIETGNAEQAVAVWNALVRSGATSLRRLDVVSGDILANPECVPGPLTGFDWRAKQNTGVAIRRDTSQRGFRIELSGAQPERIEILDQAIPVLPQNSYELRIDHAEVPAAPEGLQYRVTEIPSRNELVAGVPVARAGSASVVRFTTGSATRLVRVILEYRRAPGTTRLADSLTVSSIAIAKARS